MFSADLCRIEIVMGMACAGIIDRDKRGRHKPGMQNGCATSCTRSRLGGRGSQIPVPGMARRNIHLAVHNPGS